MARRKRDGSETIMTICYMLNVANEIGIEPIGYRLEQIIEPWKDIERGDKPIRNCKFDRQFKGYTTPSKETVADISKFASRAESILSFPLWSVLNSQPKSKVQWITFFRSLSPRIQELIFDSDVTKPTLKKEIKSKTITAIKRIVTLEALACLIGLNRYKKEYEKWIFLGTIFPDIAYLLAVNSYLAPIAPVKDLLIKFLVKNRAIFFDYYESSETLESSISSECDKQLKIFELFSNTELYAYKVSRFEVHYWIEQLDFTQIKQDLIELNTKNRLMDDRPYGLKVLAEKLNYKRREKNRLGLHIFKKTSDHKFFPQWQILDFKWKSGWA